MNHERHKQMGCPLYEYQMLSLILYCNGTCNHNLCQSQRDDTHQIKWPCFEYGLFISIRALATYEIHDENIYTGLSGVLLDVNELYCQGVGSLALNFKTNVSFSRDYRVAREFRGNEGLIIGVNLYQSWMNSSGNGANPAACDVSWISKYPTEQEVLVSRLHEFNVCLPKLRQIGQKQWIVCNNEISFDNMFLTNNNVLN